VTCDNDRQTARWFGWPVGASTVENTSAFVGLAAHRWTEGEQATWATRDQASGEPLGTVELNLSDHAHVNVLHDVPYRSPTRAGGTRG
jgi:RimJ/RimL family protein N-acetyltransferase